MTLPREPLASALALCHAVAPARAHQPILSCVLIRPAGGDDVVLTATDQERWVHVHVLPTRMEAAAALAVDAARLASIVKMSASDAVTLGAEREGWCTVEAGGARYRLPALPAADFPALAPDESATTLTLPAGQLREMLALGLIAVGRDTTCMNLCAVRLEAAGGELVVVATDGSRLATTTRTVPGAAVPAPGVLVEREGAGLLCRQLAHVDGDVRLRLSARAATATWDAITIAVPLIASEYPDWRRVIPRALPPHRVRVDADALRAALARVGLCASDSRGVKVTVGPSAPDALVLEASSPDRGEAREEVPATHRCEAPVTVGLDHRYLTDGITVAGEGEITLALTDAVGPVTVSGADARSRYVLMPQRL